MASGDRVETRLVNSTALSATDAALGSGVVAAGHVWVIKQVMLCNTSGTDRLVYLGIGNTVTGGTSSRFMHALPIAGYDTIILDTAVVLNAGDRLWGYSDFAGSVNVTVVGWDKTL
jgi:hypothetical protein